MIKKTVYLLLMCIIGLFSRTVHAQSEMVFNKYHTNNEVREIMKKIQASNPSSVQLHTIAESPGKEPVIVLEIGKNLKDVPSVFIGANFEGNIPLSTEGALYFAKMLLDSSKYFSNVKWYIMPLPNPDAAKGFYSGIKYDRNVNDLEINNDVDDLANEDGFDDLNGDGFITQMRVKDLQGTHIPSKSDARILERADAAKAIRGQYKLYSEGLDNDGDGQYNEDGPGGVNIGISFPHLFSHENKEAGLFSGQSPETYGIMRFITDRPQIAMVFTIGSSSSCLVPPKGGRRGGANLQNITIPSRFARTLGVEPTQTFTMDQVIEMVKTMVPAGMEVTPTMVAGMLGLGAVVNPLDEDLKFYTQFSEDYKKFLKEKKYNTERLDPAGEKDGSFELWAYYHLGIPSFSLNLFTIPKVKEEKKSDSGLSMDEVEKLTGDQFIALGEEKISAFMKSNNMPSRFTAASVIEMMKSGRFTPKQMVAMVKSSPKPEKEGELSEKDKALLAWSEKEWNGNGFVNWQKFNHPKLGEVEIGGYVPYLETTPKPEKIDTLFAKQLPWLLNLTTKLPSLGLADVKITDIGSGVYRLEIYIENKGYLTYPISMGQRNNQPSPVVITLSGDVQFLEGIARTPVGAIGGNQVKKISWLIKSEKKQTISAKIESKLFGTEVKQINIGG